MGDVGVLLLILMVVLTVGCLVLGWINYKIDKLKEESKFSIETISSIIALEKAVKKLNEALKIHEFRLDHQRDERYAIKKRLDILESGYPDSEFDYGTVDDHDNVVELWLDGKKYILEDKPDEDVMKLYADNKVVNETTRPCVSSDKGEVKYSYTTIGGNEASKPVEYIRYDRMYKALGGDGATEESLKRIKKLNYIYNTGLISMAEYRRRWEELTHNDS